MYQITKIHNQYHCEVVIQDGTEDWWELDKEEAIKAVIKFARIINGSYITKDDIIYVERPKNYFFPVEFSAEEQQLISDIKSGRKVVLDHSDLRVKYRITPEECELILKIREGDIKTL